MTSTWKSALFCLFAASAAAGFVGSARAQNACAADHARLCPGQKGPAAHQCMKDHQAELSPECQAQRGTMKQMHKEVHKDCKADVQRLCQGVQPGGGNIRSCLAAHAAELSPACSHAEQQLQAFKESIHPGCHADAQRLCQGVQPGGGRIIACLQSHPKELSPGCKEHVDKKLARQAGAASAGPLPASAPAAAPPTAAPPSAGR